MHLRGSAWIGAAVAAAAALEGAAGCGPSFQAVYEGDVRFEHCYALDANTSAPATAKKDCWRDWTHNYTYGQSRDRIEYAGTRLSELSLDQSLPSEDSRARTALVGNAPHKPRLVAAPVPTNAFAPPPNTMTDDKPPHATEAFHAPVPPHAPGADCADGCAMAWKTCRDVCTDKTCDACDKAYKLCVPACFPNGDPNALPPPAASGKPRAR
jgi:hypothetical protein